MPKVPKMKKNLLDMFLLENKLRDGRILREIVLAPNKTTAKKTFPISGKGFNRLTAEKYYGPYLESQKTIMENPTIGEFSYRQKYFQPYERTKGYPIPLRSMEMERGFRPEEVIERRRLRGEPDDDFVFWY